MTNKSRRQRGSRTHGGGSHKNRRGAGNQGGRGNAGRDKHEFHKYEPLGKHGFTRPKKVQDDVRTINVQKLDEDAPLLAAEGTAEETDTGYRIDARDVVEDGWEVDAVKVLGDGQVHNCLEVRADAFSNPARKLIEARGGEAITDEGGTMGDVASVTAPVKSVSESSLPNDTSNGGTKTMSNKNGTNSAPEFVHELNSKVKDGEPLNQTERDRLLDEDLDGVGAKLAYDTLVGHFKQLDELESTDVVDLYRAIRFARKQDFNVSPFKERVQEYFSDVECSDEMTAYLSEGMPERIPSDELREMLERRRNRLKRAGLAAWGNENAEQLEEAIDETQKQYLYLLRNRIDAEA